jgi:hypothetical protein
MEFYDNSLNTNVGYARHAIAIDENRSAFQRVPWGNSKDKWPDRGEGNPPWLRQLWFPGNHSDIGGSYPENECRLSDIALQWMVEQAKEVPDGIKVEESVLRLHPDPCGMQHDELRRSIFRFAGQKPREPVANATLHPSVLERFQAPAVLQYDAMKPYRPGTLRNQDKLRRFFESN